MPPLVGADACVRAALPRAVRAIAAIRKPTFSMFRRGGDEGDGGERFQKRAVNTTSYLPTTNVPAIWSSVDTILLVVAASVPGPMEVEKPARGAPDGSYTSTV